MEEVKAVETQAATVFAFAPETAPVDEAQDEHVQTPDEESGTVGEPKAQDAEQAEAQTEAVDAPAGKKTQKDIDSAIGREKRRIEERERAKYEERLSKDPIRSLGKLMVDDLIQSKGLSEEAAVQEATDNFLKAIAKREGITPTVARKLYGGAVKQEFAEQVEENKEPQLKVDRIVAELNAAKKPDGFDEETAYADDAFIELLTKYPVEAAIRIYHAETREAHAKQDIAEKLMARQRLPQMTKPGQTATPTTDWTKVDSKTFMAEKERRRRER